MHARRLYAHRGASAERPENTMPAFERAVEIGVDALEMDVHLTRDGQLIVAHDDTARRMARRPGGVGRARSRRRAAPRRRAGASSRRMARGRSRARASASRRSSDVLARVPRRADQRRHQAARPAAIEPMLALVARLHATERVTIASFQTAIAIAVRRRGYAGETALAQGEVATLLALPALLWRQLPFTGTAAQVPVHQGALRFDRPAVHREVPQPRAPGRLLDDRRPRRGRAPARARRRRHHHERPRRDALVVSAHLVARPPGVLRRERPTRTCRNSDTPRLPQRFGPCLWTGPRSWCNFQASHPLEFCHGSEERRRRQARRRQARHPAPRHGRGRDHVHRRRPGDPPRARQADRLADPARPHPASASAPTTTRRRSRTTSRSPSSTTSCSAAGTSSPTTPTRPRSAPACSTRKPARPAQARARGDQADDGRVRAGVRQEAQRAQRQEGHVEDATSPSS